MRDVAPASREAPSLGPRPAPGQAPTRGSSQARSPVLVWFRDDLRLSDHPALTAAAARGRPVICLYVFDEESPFIRPPQARPLGDASRWWLAQSLRALHQSLASLGQILLLQKGHSAQVNS
jgi:deoxyribodipyrimidine photo-lyase